MFFKRPSNNSLITEKLSAYQLIKKAELGKNWVFIMYTNGPCQVELENIKL